jgi:hypothetical protein
LERLLGFAAAFPSPPSYASLVPLFASHFSLPETALHRFSVLAGSPREFLLHLTLSLPIGTHSTAQAYAEAWVKVCHAYLAGQAPPPGADPIIAADPRLEGLHEMAGLLFAEPPPPPPRELPVTTLADAEQ